MALLPVADALAAVLSGVTPLDAEAIGLREALGRTLSSPIKATSDQPPFTASAMDGYALAATRGDTAPLTLKLIGESRAGSAYAGTVGNGEAVRIFTGAPLPDATDSIVIQEDALQTADGSVTITAPVKRGDHVRPRGQDFRSGDTLIETGKQVTSRDVLLAAAAGHARLSVTRRPRIALLATGDELIEPGQPLSAGAIYSSNSYGLGALIESVGGEAMLLGPASDTVSSLTQALSLAEAADVLVTIGGASVGDHDLVRPSLEETGWTLAFHKIAMRPGKPVFFGTRQVNGRMQRCLGLPGNPVSAMIAARVFLVPLIAKLLGRAHAAAPLATHSATLATPLAANGPRDHFMRATIDQTVSPPSATPLANQDSSLMRALAEANGLILIRANASAKNAGDTIEFLTFDF